MRNLDDFYLFVRVVDHAGFAAAGRALGLPKSKLSRRIILLEERLGVRLLNRSSRRFSVTEVGREFYERCVAMLVEAEAAEQVVAQARAEPRGIIRVSCPIAFVNYRLAALIARFMVENPAIGVHLESTNRRVDVIAEGLDVAIQVRFPPLVSTDLVMRRLGTSEQWLVASPALVSAPLTSPADLEGMPSLVRDAPRPDYQWRLQAADGRTATVVHHPRLVTDDLPTLREAALAGLGVVLIPHIVVRRDVEAGTLVNVLPGWRQEPATIDAIFASRRGLLPSVRSFLDFLARELASTEQAP